MVEAISFLKKFDKIIEFFWIIWEIIVVISLEIF